MTGPHAPDETMEGWPAPSSAARVGAGFQSGPARVRDLLWQGTVDMVKTGRAIIMFSANNEQGLDFKVHKHEWRPIDVDGVTLMLRPSEESDPTVDEPPERTHGWSSASRRRRFRKR
jgi:CRISPR-associated protein Cas2